MFWCAKGSYGDWNSLAPSCRSSKNARECSSLNHPNFLRNDGLVLRLMSQVPERWAMFLREPDSYTIVTRRTYPSTYKCKEIGGVVGCHLQEADELIRWINDEILISNNLA